MQKYIYLTDFADLSQSLKELLIDTIIEKKFWRGDYVNSKIFKLEEAKQSASLKEEIENKLNVNIVINY